MSIASIEGLRASAYGKVFSDVYSRALGPLGKVRAYGSPEGYFKDHIYRDIEQW